MRRMRADWARFRSLRGELGHRVDLHIAVLQLLFIILFQQHRADQSDNRCFIGKYAKISARRFTSFDRSRGFAVDLGTVLLGGSPGATTRRSRSRQ
jgi:hypothetical protein